MKTTPLRFISRYTRRHLGRIALLVVISCLSALAMIGMALASSRVIDLALTEPHGFKVWFFILLALLAVVAVCNVAYSNIRVRAVEQIKNEMRRQMFGELLGKSYSETAAIHSGEVLNRFTSDIQTVVEGAVSLLPQAISLCTKLLVGLLVMVFIDPIFTAIIFIGGMLMAVCVQLFSRFYKQLHKDCQQTEGKTRSFLQECVENLEVIKSFVGDRAVCGKLDGLQADNYRLQLKRNLYGNIGNTLIYVGFTIGYYGALAWGALCIAYGRMTVGTFTAFLQLIAQIRSPFRNVSGLLPQYYAMLASAERLQELSLLPDEQSQPLPAPLSSLYAQSTGLRLAGVRFAYGQETVLDGVNAVIPKAGLTAVIGTSGAGKSTLVKLLIGLVSPQEGEVLLDGAERVQLGVSTRQLFAYVPQGNLLLSGTIAENIAFYDTQVPRERIEAAAKTACLSELIAELPQGLDTPIGERGMGLSEGQVQRVAVARALLSEAPILLLDECTSALDSQTERELLQHLRALPDRTVILISHKPAVLDVADHILVVEDGSVHSA